MDEYRVKGKLFFYDDMVTKDKDGALCYDFVIVADEEPRVADIARALGENAIDLLPESTNDRPTRG